MNCQHCVYYRYESDTNFEYCTKHDTSEVAPSFGSCPDYYNQDDAKADAKYGGQDRY
jgi:hypothetical protein